MIEGLQLEEPVTPAEEHDQVDGSHPSAIVAENTVEW
jgi:hypothetical protein